MRLFELMSQLDPFGDVADNAAEEALVADRPRAQGKLDRKLCPVLVAAEDLNRVADDFGFTGSPRLCPIRSGALPGISVEL